MYRVIEITGKAGIKEFIKFPGKYLFGQSSQWVPPIVSEEVKRFDPSRAGFYTYGTSKLFAAVDDHGRWAGRIACFVNRKYVENSGRKEGFFGFFDAINNPDVVKMLFAAVAAELEKEGITSVAGPINFSTNDEVGMLIHGFSTPPTFMTNYSPPFYQTLLEALPFQPLVDLHAYDWYRNYTFPERFNRLVSNIQKRNSITIRCLNKKDFQNELDRLWPVYNESFKDVWGFTPLTKVEFDALGYSFKAFADFNLILIAEHETKTVGFALVLPDINLLIKEINGKLFPFGIFRLLARKNSIKNLRNNVLAVLPEYRNLGVAPLLIRQLVETANARKYEKGELSMVLDCNMQMTRLIKSLDFKPVKAFRVYRGLISNLKTSTQ